MSDGKQTSTWRFTHWYPNKDDSQELKGEYMMKGYHDGSTLVLESEPDATGAYLLVRLIYNLTGKVASGAWYETAVTDSDFTGTEYSGAGQLLVSEDEQTMEGLWVGAGMDHQTQELKLYTGKWELVHVPDETS